MTAKIEQQRIGKSTAEAMFMNNFAKSVPEPARRLTPQEEGRFLLTQHLRRLVNADPKAAREALEMSQEHAPELYLIAQYQPAKYWGEAVMSSDSMHSLIARDRSPKEQEELMQSLLETEDLQSLLERLP
jgi:hypothetical protein